MKHQRGFAILPLLLANWQLIVIALLVMLVLGYVWHCESVKRKHAVFVGQVQVLGEQAEKRKVEKEAKDAKQIEDALSERDAALARLRQSSSGGRRLSSAPTAIPGSRQVCIGSDAYNAAFSEFGKELGRFVEEARGYALSGDEAAIDAQTLIKGWPSP